MDSDYLLQLITEQAKKHGEDSEPDHEVGDLQAALEEAIDIMFPSQRMTLYDHLKDKGTIQ